MEPVDRVRRRVSELLEIGTARGKIKQKRLCDFVELRGVTKKGMSQAWLSNILKGRRGIPLKYLDVLADFFQIPPSELVRHDDDLLVEVTPAELALLRRVRRMEPLDVWTVYHVAELDHVLPQSFAPKIRKFPTDK